MHDPASPYWLLLSALTARHNEHIQLLIAAQVLAGWQHKATDDHRAADWRADRVRHRGVGIERHRLREAARAGRPVERPQPATAVLLNLGLLAGAVLGLGRDRRVDAIDDDQGTEEA